MRLIDADALSEEINMDVFETTDPVIRRAEHMAKAHICNLIKEQPTAYDVDKVVERLGESKEIYPICGGMLHVYAVRIDKAINAVKSNMAAGQEGGSDNRKNP